MSRTSVILLSVALVFLGSCSLTQYSTPVGSLTMVAQGTSLTEFLAIAETTAETLQYSRVHADENRSLSLVAQKPRRGMSMGPGMTHDEYWVSAHVWQNSDLVRGCDDLMAIHAALRRTYPSAQFIIDFDVCSDLRQQLSSKP